MTRRVSVLLLRFLMAACMAALCSGVFAQQTLPEAPGSADEAPQPTPGSVAEQGTMFPHSNTAPWIAVGQANVIFQAHPPFHSPYEGTNSLLGRGEYKTSLVGTLFLGVQPLRLLHVNETRALRYNTDLLLNIESAGGRGLSQALGLAGFTNLDVVRNPTLGSSPYIARVMVHQTIGFTNEMKQTPRGVLQLATQVPVRRLELRVGKLSSPDVFDQNYVLSDSHLQFTNWSVDNNGAWDYAADTRGYTYGAVAEYQDRAWAVRYGLMLMPTVANGIDLDWSVKRSRGQNMELEVRHALLPGRGGVQRFLGFVNTAHMGSYREAVAAFRSGVDATPDITRHAHTGATKYGVGYNLEQPLTRYLVLGARFGWNDGQTESYAYTEIEQTVSVGASYDGTHWGRKQDKAGIAFTSNAIKRDHQQYLAAGGLGFILGDGNLRYGRENIVEMYYNAHAWRGLFFSPGISNIHNPGYNRDRGPVWVPGLRGHIDF